jgi:hypothetical protein
VKRRWRWRRWNQKRQMRVSPSGLARCIEHHCGNFDRHHPGGLCYSWPKIFLTAAPVIGRGALALPTTVVAAKECGAKYQSTLCMSTRRGGNQDHSPRLLCKALYAAFPSVLCTTMPWWIIRPNDRYTLCTSVNTPPAGGCCPIQPSLPQADPTVRPHGSISFRDCRS